MADTPQLLVEPWWLSDGTEEAEDERVLLLPDGMEFEAVEAVILLLKFFSRITRCARISRCIAMSVSASDLDLPTLVVMVAISPVMAIRELLDTG